MNTKVVNMQPDLSTLDKMIDDRNLKKVAEKLKKFAAVYYESLPNRELLAMDAEEVYGSTVSSWQFIQKRESGKAKVRVFNPDLEMDGWQAAHTVVQVCIMDMPFAIDTVRMEINRLSLAVHTVHSSVFYAQRNDKGELIGSSFEKAFKASDLVEAVIYLEVDKHTEEATLKLLEKNLAELMRKLDFCIGDYQAFNLAIEKASAEIADMGATKASDEPEENLAFLQWLSDENFTFLGYDEFAVEKKDGVASVVWDQKKSLGLFRYEKAVRKKKDEISDEISAFVTGDSLVSLFKADIKSTIHRPAYPDYVVIKRFNKNHQVVGGMRFMGLFTSNVYVDSPKNIPIIRKKIDRVWDFSGVDRKSHMGKEINRILEVFPRDELIQSSAEELFNTTMGILSIKERRQTRVFIRQDAYGKFITCLIFTPRDIYTTELRIKMQSFLGRLWSVTDSEFNVYFSESTLARIHFVLRLEKPLEDAIDAEDVERKIQRIARSWVDDLHDSLIDATGEEKGNYLFHEYRSAFPASYREDFTAKTAVVDIQNIEELREYPERSITMSFYRGLEEKEGQLRFKLHTIEGSLPLSDLLPILENFGLRVLGEHPYSLEMASGQKAWIHDFSIVYTLAEKIDMQAVKSLFQQAFRKIWFGKAESDTFNKLVLGAGVDWRDIAMLRAYARYMKQTHFGISEQYIAETLSRYIPLCKMLVQAFSARFALNAQWTDRHRELMSKEIKKEIIASLESVEQLNEDRVIRRYLELINATVRTNFFQKNDDDYKDYLSFKLSPQQLGQMPQPVPMHEIFVYSARVEGVHLRGGRVARGGLRWSDRHEDYRTEILGLVKAQQVKNAIIVPVGAKGGFVGKQLTPEMSRDEWMEEGIACYRTFIRALLDVTDNLIDGKVVPPADVIRHDKDDVYLVVAADKGTATFSDISNEIAKERQFWLGDAFASGGSVGYDHKKMGITAKGAWVSVQRHFREKGINIQKENFSVIGIGDMSGDVFGNGMLLSPCIELKAAFNHQHIFIDPSPDTKKSYAERKRLFQLPRSSWEDYDAALISKGGGVFSRAAKSITISDIMKQCFDIEADYLTPSDLIQALLRAPVDLIWNGGIGTYIKSRKESHADVGDKANDTLRINGDEVRAKVVGEGGNLGMTQLARVEYSLTGGACYTDFIDNAGGVDCSDHEVNIKIMLNDLVDSGDLTPKKRNALFLSMTDAVGELVLANNYSQTRAIAFAHKESIERADEYMDFIKSLEDEGKLDRELEFLPDNDTLFERLSQGASLTKPELAICVSYAKADLKEQLNMKAISQDRYLMRFLEKAFPVELIGDCEESLAKHRLRSEIIATQLANDIVNNMGVTFAHRLLRSNAGATLVDVAKSYVIAREVFGFEDILNQICALDYQVAPLVQEQMLYFLIRLIRRASRWILVNRRSNPNVESEVKFFKAGVDKVKSSLSDFLLGTARDTMKARYDSYIEQGVDESLARFIAASGVMSASLGIVEVSHLTGYSIEKVAEAYFGLSETLALDWVADQINNLAVESHWHELARIKYRGDLEKSLRMITQSVLMNAGTKRTTVKQKLSTWMDNHSFIVNKWQALLDQIKPYERMEYPMFSVALKELQELAALSDQ